MRMTRAALRAQESCATPSSERSFQLKSQGISDDEPLIHEDEDKDDSGFQSSDAKNTDQEDSSRLALRDITLENYPTTPAEENVAGKTPGKKTRKGKNGRGRKKAAVEEAQTENTESTAEHNSLSQLSNVTATESISIVGPEEITGENSSTTVISLAEPIEPLAVDEAITTAEQSQQSVEKQSTCSYEQRIVVFPETQQIPLEELSTILNKRFDNDEEQTTSKTTKLDPEIHPQSETELLDKKDTSEDSFVVSIKTRSPSKLSQSQLAEKEYDSFVEDIITRSPAKNLSSPRVEDSVEALDALEEAIEKFSNNLPDVQDLTAESPVRQHKTPAKAATSARQTNTSTTPHSKSKKSPISLLEKLTMSTTPNTPKENLPKSIVKERVKEFESKPAVPAHRRVTSVSLTKRAALTAAKMPSKSKHVSTKSVPSISSTTGMSFSNSPAKPNPNLVKNRVASGPLSTSRPAFVPAKSDKPITKSNFVLPGEAVAAKLKAQREERAKREEEAAEKKTQVKARPAPSKVSRSSVMPRENKASQARMSMMVKGNSENKENVAPRRPATRPMGASVTVTKRKVDNNQANTTTRRATTVAPPTMTTISKRATQSTAPPQRVTSISTSSNKGKEVFDRQRNNREAELKEKREKEEAAKRARAEAAERGRQASREWAEKQKKKLVEKTVVDPKPVPA